MESLIQIGNLVHINSRENGLFIVTKRCADYEILVFIVRCIKSGMQYKMCADNLLLVGEKNKLNLKKFQRI